MSPSVARALRALPDARISGHEWAARCRAHDDRKASLSVAAGDDGRVLLTCHAGCATERVVAALGLTMADLFPQVPRVQAIRTHDLPGRPSMKDFAPIVAQARALLTERREDPTVAELLRRFHGTVETLVEVGGGLVDDAGTLRVLIPEFDPDGQFCGAKVRPGKDSGKEQDLAGGHHGLMGQVPGLHARPKVRVLASEGGHDLLAAISCGRFSDHVVVALPGARFFMEERGKAWASALAGREVVLCLDADDAGRQGTDAAVAELRSAGATVRSLDWARVFDGGTIAKDLAEIIAHDHPAHLERLVAAVTEAPRNGLRFRTVEELRAMPESNVEWLLHGLLAVGAVTLLAAAFKAGKSTLIVALLRALEIGEPFAGFEAAKTSAVCLSEEPASAVLEKVDAFGVRETVFLTRGDFNPALAFGDYVREAAATAKRRGARLLVIDTFSRFSRLGADGEKDAGAVQGVIEHALAAAGQGLAVLVVTHHRKAEGEDGQQIRGSTALPAAADVLIEVRRLRDEPRSPFRALSCQSRFRETPTEEVVLELRGDRYLRAGSPEVVRQDAARVRVRRILADAKEPLTREQVVESAGGKREANARALKALADAGEVTRSGAGRKGEPHRYALHRAFPSLPSLSRPECRDDLHGEIPVPPSLPVGEDGGKAGIARDGTSRVHPPKRGTGTVAASPSLVSARGPVAPEPDEEWSS